MISCADIPSLAEHINVTEPVFPGFVEIQDSGQTAFGSPYEDSIDHIWLGLLHGLEHLDEDVQTPFVYQPIDFCLKEVNQKLVISVHHNQVVIKEWAFPFDQGVQAILTGAEEFFAVVKRLNLHLFKDEIDTIEARLTNLKAFHKKRSDSS